MSDFPRGWTLTTQAANPATASITVPAIAGVVHVLDAFFAAAGAGAAVGLNANITLTSSDGVFAGYQLGIVAVEAAAGALGSDSDSGLDLAAGPGASLTIAFNSATPAGIVEFLRIKGHDI